MKYAASHTGRSARLTGQASSTLCFCMQPTQRCMTPGTRTQRFSPSVQPVMDSLTGNCEKLKRQHCLNSANTRYCCHVGNNRAQQLACVGASWSLHEVSLRRRSFSSLLKLWEILRAIRVWYTTPTLCNPLHTHQCNTMISGRMTPLCLLVHSPPTEMIPGWCRHDCIFQTKRSGIVSMKLSRSP